MDSSVMEIVQLLWNPVTRQINYIKDLHRNIEDLESKMDELSSRESDLKNEVERAKLEQRVLSREVDNWLKETEAIKHEVSMIQKEYGENMRCLQGCFNNYYAQRHLGKRILDTISEVERLYENGKFEDGVAVLPLPTTAHTLPTSSLIGKTAEKAKNQILSWILHDKNVGIIGVLGMGGVGKTTIMKSINNHLNDGKSFNYIFWVTASREIDLKKLQMDIAKEVELTFPEDEIEERRATELHETLTKRQKFLIILDDIWKPFSLEKIGIPEPSKENGCKVVLTTREFKVCQGIRTQKTLAVNPLPEDEAWALFEAQVGKEPLQASDLQDIARFVARECGGLPLALNTVGAALRDVKEASEWKHALHQLKSSPFRSPDMQENVFKQLKFSYDHLCNEKMQACFLYCSLYSEDYEIHVDKVIRNWIWEGLIDEEGSMEDQINEGHAIVNGLVRNCMLQNVNESEQVEFVKMHDLLREMAICITKNTPHFIVKARTGLEDPIENGEWVGDVQRVSLIENKIHSFSVIPNWPKLTTLFLQENPLSFISPSFFLHMSALTVLDLSCTKIKCLPNSLSDLVSLRALLLSGCHCLSEMPSLANLKELRELDLSSAAIRQLPLGMEWLVNLRFLSLSYTYNLQRFQPGLISKLIRLETLEMMYSSYPLQECSVLDEILTLSRFAQLALFIPDLATFTNYIKSGHTHKLRNFTFDVGGKRLRLDWRMPRPMFRIERSVYAKSSHNSTEENSFLLPANTLELCLDGWANLSLFSLLSRSIVRRLKSCHVADCPNIESIWSEENDSSLLKLLEGLSLSCLESLQVIFQGVACYDSFQGLKSVITGYCPKLKYLFTAQMLKNLQNLEAIVVLQCDGMEELVYDEEDEIPEVFSSGLDNTIVLPKLKLLELHEVFNLQRICSKLLVCNSMGNIEISHCPKLKKISLSINNSSIPIGGWIKGEMVWWEALEWDDPTTKGLLLPIFQEENDLLDEILDMEEVHKRGRRS